jgi:hypothetical protein
MSAMLGNVLLVWHHASVAERTINAKKRVLISAMVPVSRGPIFGLYLNTDVLQKPGRQNPSRANDDGVVRDRTAPAHLLNLHVFWLNPNDGRFEEYREPACLARRLNTVAVL